MKILRKPTLIVFFMMIIMAVFFGYEIDQAAAMGSAAQSALKKNVKVLAILPLTGPAAAIGEYPKNGILLYKENVSDSILSITVDDSQTNPGNAVAVLERSLIGTPPDIIISTLSSVSGAVVPKASEKGLLVIGVNVSSEKIFNGPNVQRINDRARDSALPLAKLAVKKHVKVGIIYSNEEYGEACKTSFVEYYSGKDRTIIGPEAYDLKDLNIRNTVQKVMIQKPDAIFVAGYGPAYMAIFESLRASKYPGIILADMNFSNPAVYQGLGAAAEGVIFPGMDICLAEPVTPKGKEFAAKYRKRFNQDVFVGAPYIYDALSMIEHLARQGKPLNQASFTEIGTWDGVAGRLDLLPGGECQYHFILMKREGGKNVQM